MARPVSVQATTNEPSPYKTKMKDDLLNKTNMNGILNLLPAHWTVRWVGVFYTAPRDDDLQTTWLTSFKARLCRQHEAALGYHNFHEGQRGKIAGK